MVYYNCGGDRMDENLNHDCHLPEGRKSHHSDKVKKNLVTRLKPD
jgi:hypothetical protein